MSNTQAPPSSTLGSQVTCPKCGSMYPAGNVHHCATANLPSQVSPGQTCPRCGCWHTGFHYCGMSYIPLPGVPPQPAPFPRLVTGAEVDALRAEVERLTARVAELEGK